MPFLPAVRPPAAIITSLGKKGRVFARLGMGRLAPGRTAPWTPSAPETAIEAAERKMTRGTIRILALALGVALGAIFAPHPGTAQEVRGKGFYDVEELRRLLEVAREAGFSEQELREITIEDEGKVINVWQYLQELERKKREAAARLKAQQEKVYLTVQEQLEELKKDDPEDLTRLRDKIPTE